MTRSDGFVLFRIVTLLFMWSNIIIVIMYYRECAPSVCRLHVYMTGSCDKTSGRVIIYSIIVYYLIDELDETKPFFECFFCPFHTPSGVILSIVVDVDFIISTIVGRADDRRWHAGGEQIDSCLNTYYFFTSFFSWTHLVKNKRTLRRAAAARVVFETLTTMHT